MVVGGLGISIEAEGKLKSKGMSTARLYECVRVSFDVKISDIRLTQT